MKFNPRQALDKFRINKNVGINLYSKRTQKADALPVLHYIVDLTWLTRLVEKDYNILQKIIDMNEECEWSKTIECQRKIVSFSSQKS